MSQRILDDVETLMNLKRDELDEILLDPKYNKANLRQMLRLSLGSMKTYKNAWAYEREKREEAEEKIEEMKEKEPLKIFSQKYIRNFNNT